jgi:hypothetical protein
LESAIIIKTTQFLEPSWCCTTYFGPMARVSS